MACYSAVAFHTIHIYTCLEIKWARKLCCKVNFAQLETGIKMKRITTDPKSAGVSDIENYIQIKKNQIKGETPLPLTAISAKSRSGECHSNAWPLADYLLEISFLKEEL